jgi:hypothetical protein
LTKKCSRRQPSSFLKRPLRLLSPFLWNGPICGSPSSATFIRLPSEDIVEELTKIEDGPWAETIHGKPLTQAQLARLLAPFRIRPTIVYHSRNHVRRGYLVQHCVDAFSLDLPIRRPSSQAGRQGFDPRLQLLDLKPYTPIGYLVSKHLPLGPRWTSNCVSSWTSPAGRQAGILYLILIMVSGCSLDGDRLRSEKSGTASWAGAPVELTLRSVSRSRLLSFGAPCTGRQSGEFLLKLFCGGNCRKANHRKGQ